jgi:hypothetical protein
VSGRTALALAIAPIAAIALPGCGQTLPEQVTEAKIAEAVQQQSGARLKVDCPADVEVGKGGRFTCTGAIDGAPPIDISVEQVDDKGGLRVTQVRPR